MRSENLPHDGWLLGEEGYKENKRQTNCGQTCVNRYKLERLTQTGNKCLLFYLNFK